MTTRHARDLTRLLQGVAAPYVAAVNIEPIGSGHLRAVFSIGVQPVFIVASSSPSDADRAYRNIRADARRGLHRFPLRVASTARECAAVGQPLWQDLPGVKGVSAAGIVAIAVGKMVSPKHEYFRTHPEFRRLIPTVDTEVGIEKQ